MIKNHNLLYLLYKKKDNGGDEELHIFISYCPLDIITNCYIIFILLLMSIMFHNVHDIWLQMATNDDQIQRAGTTRKI